MQVTVKCRKNEVGFIMEKDAGRIKSVRSKGEKFCVLFVSKVKITHAYGSITVALRVIHLLMNPLLKKENKKHQNPIKASKESRRKCFVLFHLGAAKI